MPSKIYFLFEGLTKNQRVYIKSTKLHGIMIDQNILANITEIKTDYYNTAKTLQDYLSIGSHKTLEFDHSSLVCYNLFAKNPLCYHLYIENYQNILKNPSISI